MNRWSRLFHSLSPLFLFAGLLPFGLCGYRGAFPPSEVAQLSTLLVVTSSFLFLTLVGRQLPDRWAKKIFCIAILLAWILLLVLTVGNWWHEQYFGSYFGWVQLGFGADIWQVVGAWTAFEYKIAARILALSSLLPLVLAAISYRSFSYRSGVMSITAVLLFIILIYGSWVLHRSYRFYSDSNQLSLNGSFYHPVHAFFAVNTTDNIISEAEQKANQEFRMYNQPMHADLNKDFSKWRVPQDKQYNIIIIMMESIRASMLGYYSNSESLTPNLDKLAARYIVARNYYANTTYTLKSEVGVWCGIFDNYVKPPLSKESDLGTHLKCLPGILKEHDYTTLYYHGHEAKFYDRKEFLPKIGFDKIHFYKDDVEWQKKNHHPRIIGWGLSDRQLFDYAADNLLSETGQPFFAHVMTLSSHYPFNNEWDADVPFPVHKTIKKPADAYLNYQNAAHYVDSAIGGFWKKFSQSPLYHNTIVVITADHGVWSFPENTRDPVLQNELLFRAPMIIYHPDIHEHIEIEQVSSHLDVLPTLLALLGFSDISNDHAGKNMLTPVEKPWAIMMKNGSASIRTEHQFCLRSNQICGGVQQDCISVYPELIKQKELQDDCYEISGDLLQGGNYQVAQDKKNNRVTEAIRFITYQNKEAILK